MCMLFSGSAVMSYLDIGTVSVDCHFDYTDSKTLILFSVGAEADDDRIELLLSEVKGKDVTELIASGREKLASVPSGGGVAVAVAASGGGAAAPAAAEAKKEEKVEEPEESDDVSYSCDHYAC